MTKLDEIKAAVAEYEAASRATFELVVAEKVDQTAVNKAHATLEAIEAKLAQVAPDYLKALLAVVDAAVALDKERLEYLKLYLDWSEIGGLLDALAALDHD